MRVCCKRLGAPFICERGFVTQALRFRRVDAEASKGIPQRLRWQDSQS